MNQCKDCIHYEACEDWAIEYGDNFFPFNNCQVFKPKSRYIELPCAVGDTVYRIYTRSWVGEDKVDDFCITDRGLFYYDDKSRETSCDKFGKTVFLTKEEAEKALERSSNEKV